VPWGDERYFRLPAYEVAPCLELPPLLGSGCWPSLMSWALVRPVGRQGRSGPVSKGQLERLGSLVLLNALVGLGGVMALGFPQVLGVATTRSKPSSALRAALPSQLVALLVA